MGNPKPDAPVKMLGREYKDTALTLSMIGTSIKDFQPTARSYEHLLQSVFQRVKDLFSEGYSYKTDFPSNGTILRGIGGFFTII